MEARDSGNDARTQIVRELGRMLRRQANGRWSDVNIARRAEKGHQVWRFRPGSDGGERFLHVSNDALDRTRSTSRLLFKQLRAGRWLSRLDEGGETALRLGGDGRVEPYPTTR
jgi:hypothetical protein